VILARYPKHVRLGRFCRGAGPVKQQGTNKQKERGAAAAKGVDKTLGHGAALPKKRGSSRDQTNGSPPRTARELRPVSLAV